MKRFQQIPNLLTIKIKIFLMLQITLFSLLTLKTHMLLTAVVHVHQSEQSIIDNQVYYASYIYFFFRKIRQ